MKIQTISNKEDQMQNGMSASEKTKKINNRLFAETLRGQKLFGNKFQVLNKSQGDAITNFRFTVMISIFKDK